MNAIKSENGSIIPFQELCNELGPNMELNAYYDRNNKVVVVEVHGSVTTENVKISSKARNEERIVCSTEPAKIFF